MYYIIDKSFKTVKEIETEQGVLNYLRPILDKPNELTNLKIIEGDEYEVITKLRIKDKNKCA